MTTCLIDTKKEEENLHYTGINIISLTEPGKLNWKLLMSLDKPQKNN